MPLSGPSSDELLARLRRDLARRGVLDGIETLVTACSGGGDSVALVDLMARIGREAGIEISVAHVDHGVRGEDARRDAERVRALAAARSLPMYEERMSVEGGERPSEARLRQVRLEAFRRIAERAGSPAFALGHTRDDRAETLLLNAARGSGIAGLGALRWRRSHGRLLLVRPLLGVSRERLR